MCEECEHANWLVTRVNKSKLDEIADGLEIARPAFLDTASDSCGWQLKKAV